MICPSTVLLILEPFSFILLPIRKSINSISLTLSFHIFTFISIPVFINSFTFPMRFSRSHFTLVCSTIFSLT